MSEWRPSEWEPTSFDDAKLAVWGTTSWGDGVEHSLAMITPHLQGPRILDYGCGMGRLTRPIAQANPDWMILGYDTSMTMIAYAQANNHLPNIRYLGFVPDHVDTMFSMLVFQHLPDVEVRDILMSRPADRLHFQYVTNGDPGPLNHPRSWSSVDAWLTAAGYTQRRYEPDPVYPEWQWVTAE